jgi:hypothetical protein
LNERELSFGSAWRARPSRIPSSCPML